MQEAHVADKIKTSYRHVDLVFGRMPSVLFPELFIPGDHPPQPRVRQKGGTRRYRRGAARCAPVERESLGSPLCMAATISFLLHRTVCARRERSRDPEHILEEVRELGRFRLPGLSPF
jgi:tRNA-2-methylthio-N6-dimethylallyladenosine synthase